MVLSGTGRFILRAMALSGLGAWLVFWLSIAILGGSAANGYVLEGHYFLGEHGKYVEVSPETYRTSELLQRVGLAGLPVGAVGFFALRRLGDPAFFFWGMAVALSAFAPVLILWIGTSVGAPLPALCVGAVVVWFGLLVATAVAWSRNRRTG
jgi:hypothetical protein